MIAPSAATSAGIMTEEVDVRTISHDDPNTNSVSPVLTNAVLFVLKAEVFVWFGESDPLTSLWDDFLGSLLSLFTALLHSWPIPFKFCEDSEILPPLSEQQLFRRDYLSAERISLILGSREAVQLLVCLINN